MNIFKRVKNTGTWWGVSTKLELYGTQNYFVIVSLFRHPKNGMVSAAKLTRRILLSLHTVIIFVKNYLAKIFCRKRLKFVGR
jgi:hypothetical protein